MASNKPAFCSALSEKNQLIVAGASLAASTLNGAFSTFSDLQRHKVEHPDGGITNNTGARAPISVGLFNVVGPTIDNRVIVEKRENSGVTMGQGLAFVGGAAVGIVAGIYIGNRLTREGRKKKTGSAAQLLFNAPVGEDDDDDKDAVQN